MHETEPEYSGATFADSLSFIDANLPTLLSGPRRLYHQDAGNMLCAGDRLLGFFDLEMCRVGTLAIQIGCLIGRMRHVDCWQAFINENMKTIDDPQKREIYTVCCGMAHGLHGLSDCHHSTFRWIESWIHGIGRFSLQMASRKAGVEAKRLGRLLFGYALGLDRWLQGVPMQWLLLDLGHIDLGFDPRSEILRVYANLADRTPVKKWLAACLWYTLVLERPASLCDWGHRHRELVEMAQAKGISVREWMDTQLGRDTRNR